MSWEIDQIIEKLQEFNKSDEAYIVDLCETSDKLESQLKICIEALEAIVKRKEYVYPKAHSQYNNVITIAQSALKKVKE